MRGFTEAKAAAKYAAENTPLRRALREQCPVCLGALDTGYECNECGFDAWPLIDEWLTGNSVGATDAPKSSPLSPKGIQ